MSDPLTTMASTQALTVSWPTYEPGEIYDTLRDGAEGLFDPLETVINDTDGLVSVDPETYANTVVADVSILWSYLDYGRNLEPSLVSISLLIGAFFTVMLVKLVLVVVMYVKNLVANWL